MALYNMFGKIKVKSYSIDQRDVLGQGAFGIVYKGRDAKKNEIAVKRIDGDVHPRILTQDLNRLIKLDHQNVMKILDVEKNENIVWMMMPFCGLGDLNHYYRTRDVLPGTNLEVMKQIMSGISYLHSQDIVHRDIKPGNILVAAELPLQVLLADFDVSKCLDPEVVTSLMSSNVGTLAFKAPEFFQRTSPGKIEYHRNVDIYAAGRTFLAILQAKKGKKMLIPQIETPMDETELHTDSIGRLITERIKYKVRELDIVKTEGPQKKLKLLISLMTCVNPEVRLSAEVVLYVLHDLDSVDADLKIQKMNLVYEGTLEIAQLDAAYVSNKDQIVARTEVDGRFYIRVMNRLSGEVSSEFPSKCNHYLTVCLLVNHTDAGYVLEGCSFCRMIRNYDIQSGQCSTVYTSKELNRIYHGPTGSILTYSFPVFGSARWGISIMKWDKEHRVLNIDKQVYFEGKLIRICYNELFDMLVVICEGNEIKAMNLVSEADTSKLPAPIWELSGVIDGLVIQPDAVASDKKGNIYVGDGANNRILKISSLTGEVLGTISLEEKNEKQIHDLFWLDNESYLIVRRGHRIISFCVPRPD